MLVKDLQWDFSGVYLCIIFIFIVLFTEKLYNLEDEMSEFKTTIKSDAVLLNNSNEGSEVTNKEGSGVVMNNYEGDKEDHMFDDDENLKGTYYIWLYSATLSSMMWPVMPAPFESVCFMSGKSTVWVKPNILNV